MKELKLLFVGNSFALDTIQHAPEIAHALGVERVLSGVHWLTDIIGGGLISASLVTAYHASAMLLNK